MREKLAILFVEALLGALLVLSVPVVAQTNGGELPEPQEPTCTGGPEDPPECAEFPTTPE